MAEQWRSRRINYHWFYLCRRQQDIHVTGCHEQSCRYAVNTTTGHTYSATISYDGSNLTISMFDVTAGGACPGAACFTTTWTGVNVPVIVGGSTAWVGLAGSTGDPNTDSPLLINSFSYSSN